MERESGFFASQLYRCQGQAKFQVVVGVAVGFGAKPRCLRNLKPMAFEIIDANLRDLVDERCGEPVAAKEIVRQHIDETDAKQALETFMKVDIAPVCQLADVRRVEVAISVKGLENAKFVRGDARLFNGFCGVAGLPHTSCVSTSTLAVEGSHTK